MGYLGNGLTITGTQNSKRIVVDATPNQTISTVTGGYLVGQLDVYRNGVKLVDTQDYTAADGSSVTFLAAASEGDELEFVVFENFDVASALSKSGGSLNGDLVVTGIATFNSDVSIGGTLTYEDVTNIDSVGLITARSGVEIGTPGIAATLTAAGGAVFTGVVTATTFSGGTFTGDGTGLTGVASTDNINTSTLAQFTGGVGIADSIFHIGDDNTAIRFPAADTFTVETAGDERVRVDSSGRLLVNTTSSLIQDYRYSTQIFKSGSNVLDSGALGLYFNGVDPSAGSRATALGFYKQVNTGIVRNNDGLGVLRFNGYDGSTYNEAATIESQVDGTPGSNEMPGRIVFSTNDGTASASPTERLRISSTGKHTITGATNGELSIKAGSSTGNDIIAFLNSSGTTRGNITYDTDNDFLFFNVNQDEKLRISSTGLVGINTNSPDGRLHVFEGLAGAVTANGNANDLVVENSTTGGISILTPDASHGYIIFGSPTSNEGAILRYRDADNLFTIGTEDADGQVVFRSGAGTERLRIGSSGQIGLSGANYGTSGQVLTSNGSGSAVTWQDVTAGITTHVGTASGIVTSVFLNDATDHKVTVTGFVTFTATQAGTEGQSHTIRIVNSGIATVGFSTYFLFPSGAAPVLPTADGAVSLISFTVHDSVGAGCTQLLAGASVNFS